MKEYISQAKIQTPYYLYDCKLLEQILKNVVASSKSFDYNIHYAIKANSNIKIVQQIANFGLGVDCVSGNEILHSLKCGFPVNKIVFAGVGKADWEIEIAIENNILNFNCESYEEVLVIDKIAKSKNQKVNIAIRINPDIDPKTHEKITTGLKNNKFGVNYLELTSFLDQIKGCRNINLTGLHFHIGSQITDLNVFKQLCLKVNFIQEDLRNKGYVFSYLNLGGGLGINYYSPDENSIPDFHSYFKVFDDNLVKYSGQKIYFELGRSIVGSIGSLMTKVLYNKESNGIHYLILDAGMTDLIRPALYQAYHKIENLTSRSSEIVAYDIVGPICESSDYFAKERLLPKTKRGDMLAIRSVGAYGEVMVSHYNLRTSPGVVYLD